MERIIEPELMLEEAQSLAYAQADFEQPHSNFIRLFQAKFNQNITGKVLDLGCGTGDITLRFANAYRHCNIDGIDGSPAMLHFAQQDLLNLGKDLKNRVNFDQGILPQFSLNQKDYDVIISNSLLHHLHNPLILWQTIKNYSKNHSIIFIMDLLRPQNINQAQELVNLYAKNEPEILQRDFFNSLCAAFTLTEIKQQLSTENLDYLTVEQISDRHVIVYGKIKPIP